MPCIHQARRNASPPINLLEFAFDTNPLASNTSAFTIVRDGDGSPRLSYPRRTGFSGLRYTVLKSDDLIMWSPVTNGYLDETTEPVTGRSVEPMEVGMGTLIRGHRARSLPVAEATFPVHLSRVTRRSTVCASASDASHTTCRPAQELRPAARGVSVIGGQTGK